MKLVAATLEVLFVSGYSDEVLIDRGDRPAAAAFLPKPYSPSSLVEKVRRLLEDEP